jgi:hypothetical protein
MKVKSIFLTVTFFIAMLGIQSCSNNKDDSAATSTVQLKLVDAPDDDYNQVWVEIIDVKYNRNDDDTGWTSFEGYPKETGDMVDLMTLTAGTNHILTNDEIDSGMLSQVRLVLGEHNYLIIKGDNDQLSDEIPLSTPSAQQSGLKLHLQTELEAGYSYTFWLDWDVEKSIVKAGNSGNYNLKPVIRVQAEVNSGTIMGNIADVTQTTETPMPLDAWVTLYDSSNAEIATTLSNAEGNFMLQGVPAGDYVIIVTKENYNDSDPKTAAVVNGQDTNVGTIYVSSK